jgi:sugar/nucleoside kinase (ribokinase family)
MIKLKKTPKNKPLCVGTGLVALDVILNGSPITPAKLCAGGSCGNIMSILSYLGWESKPIARLSKNEASKNILKDFTNFDVKTNLLTRTDDGSTPIIIHRILKDKNGNPKHRFEFKVPTTKEWLPSYKPVLSSMVDDITKKQPQSQVFYFDRVSRSSIDLAKFYKEKGALIVFEPTSYKEDKQFSECLSVADIVKFSSDRINNYADLFPSSIAPLEIETLGKEGLRYRLKAEKANKWHKVQSFKLTNIIDAAGAGDWCTAGIINELGQKGAQSFYSASKQEIENALNIGQALGALNCTFDGARGMMYNIDYNSINSCLSAIVSNNIIPKGKISQVKIVTIKNFDFESIL